MTVSKLTCLGLVLGACTLPAGAASSAPETTSPDDRFIELSLEDLLNVEVTSVSKRSQRLADVAAAVYVINAEDIRRSGARSLPEVLRMAPGVDVARISGDRWAVSMRSHTEYLANKLMVLVDGRSAYSPNFSGVFWNTLQIPLENIERIEVIRGPGGSIWGVNAVNGVINIITRAASAIQGTLVSAGYGNQAGPFVLARHGGQVNDDTYFSTYLQGERADANTTPAGVGAQDGYRHASAGFRLDSHAGKNTWMASGNLYESHSNGVGIVSQFTSPYSALFPFRDNFSGADIQGRLTRALADGSELQLNASWTHSKFDSSYIAFERQDILDLELQQHLRPSGAHDLIWGLGYRWFNDEIASGAASEFSQPTENLHTFSLFVQDDWRLADAVRLTLGGRLDDQKYTGVEFQPSLRLLWNVQPQHSLWLSMARAKRIPSRAERTSKYSLEVLPDGTLENPGPLPVQFQMRGGKGFGSENLEAFELGYRGQVQKHLVLDASVYVHRYSELRANSVPGAPELELTPIPHVLIPSYFINSGELTIKGLELSADWRPSDDWHVQASYSYSQTGDFSGGHAIYSSYVPRHLVSLRSGWKLGRNVDFDAWLRHVAERPTPLSAIDAYTNLDLRLSWRPAKGVELALVGQNLLDAKHVEYLSTIPSMQQSQIERGAYVQAKLNW